MKLKISDKLKTVLEEISEKSPLSKVLLDATEVENEDYYYNYLDFSKEHSDRFSYGTRDRIERMKEENPEIQESDFWERKRFCAKVPSFMLKYFKSALKDKFTEDLQYSIRKDLELFHSLIKNIVNKPVFEFRVVEGEDIRKYYDGRNYIDESGSLGGSCMKHDFCQEFFDLYVSNPNKIKMLIMIDPRFDKIYGRALLWYDEEKNIMDRIYTSLEQYSEFFKNWATENGFIYKSYQNWGSTTLFIENGVEIEYKKILKVDNFDFQKYPYLDTFKWVNLETGELFNYFPENTDNCKLMIQTDGTDFYEPNTLGYDEIQKKYIFTDYLVRLDYLNLSCEDNTTVYSNPLECHILTSDSLRVEKVINGQKISYYIFKQEYEQYNDLDKINKYEEEYSRQMRNRNSLSQLYYSLEH